MLKITDTQNNINKKVKGDIAFHENKNKTIVSEINDYECSSKLKYLHHNIPKVTLTFPLESSMIDALEKCDTSLAHKNLEILERKLQEQIIINEENKKIIQLMKKTIDKLMKSDSFKINKVDYEIQTLKNKNGTLEKNKSKENKLIEFQQEQISADNYEKFIIPSSNSWIF